MQKCLIVLTLLFSMSLWASPDWNPYFMNHERFVHLSAQEKEQVVIKTMEMIVELEGKYRKAVVNHEPAKEILQKYTHLLKTLNSLLINEAYADEVDPAFHKLAKDFSSLLSDLGEQACIYAGYVSILVEGRCSSPNLLAPNSKNAAMVKRIKAAYLTKTAQPNAKCGGTKKISCNPVVFGYMKNNSKVPFCVATSPDESHNAAYECMKLSLGTSTSNGADKKETRINYLTAALSDTQTAPAFNAAHKFIYRTCVCEDTELNVEYKKYMKPHRTCFGMLNTLRDIKSQECSPLSDEKMGTFASDWNKFLSTNPLKEQKAQKNVGFDDAYKALMEKASLKAMCGIGDDEPVRDPASEDGEQCTPECKKQIVGDVEVVMCLVKKITVTKTVDGKKEVKEITEFEEAELPLEKGKTEITYKSKDGTSHVCKVKDPRDENDGKLSCNLTSGGDSKNPTITLAFENLKEGQEPPKVSWKGADGAVDATNPLVFNAKATSVAQTLIATFEPPAGDKAATTKAATTKAATPAPATQKPHPAATAVAIASPAAGAAVDAAIRMAEAAAAAAANSCELKIVDDKSGKTYAIKTTPTPEGPTSVKVDAEVTITGGDEKLPSDYMIVWVRKGYKGPKTEVKKKVETETKAAPDAVPEGTPATATKTPEQIAAEEKAEEEKKANAPFAEGEKGSPTAAVTEIKILEKYDTCAHLLDEKGSKVADSCSEIPPVTLPQNPGGGNRPPQFLSPSYNTRTLGIQ